VVEVKDIEGGKVTEVELPDSIFNVSVKKCVLHDAARMQMSARRRGTASVKRRSDVKGSGSKMFRQKGTGRARRGDIKSQILRGGGVAFGPEPRSYGFKLPKKVRRLALKMAISSKLQAESLVVLDGFELQEIKTKTVARAIAALNLEKPLIVVDKEDRELELSARNIPGVKVLRVEGLNVYDILNHEHLVLLEPSIKLIEGRLAA
ncbi:MAG: 50S ribosomal protein L4, partial [Desulfosalsimonadaceae bacterium]